MKKYILVSNELTDSDVYWSGNDKTFLRVITSDDIQNDAKNPDLIFEAEIDEYDKEIQTAIATTKTQHYRSKISPPGCKKCGNGEGERPLLTIFDPVTQEIVNLCPECDENNYKKISSTTPLHFLMQMLGG